MRLLTDAECGEIARKCLANVYDVDDLYWILPQEFRVMADGEDAEVIAEKLAELWSIVLGEFAKNEDEEGEE